MQVQDSVTHGIAGSAFPSWRPQRVLFVILGSDRARARHVLNQKLAQFDPTGMDTDRIGAASNSFEALFADVTAAPFFGSQRVIVLNGLLVQSASKGGRGSKTKTDSDVARRDEVIPDKTNLILFYP